MGEFGQVEVLLVLATITLLTICGCQGGDLVTESFVCIPEKIQARNC